MQVESSDPLSFFETHGADRSSWWTRSGNCQIEGTRWAGQDREAPERSGGKSSRPSAPQKSNAGATPKGIISAAGEGVPLQRVRAQGKRIGRPAWAPSTITVPGSSVYEDAWMRLSYSTAKSIASTGTLKRRARACGRRTQGHSSSSRRVTGQFDSDAEVGMTRGAQFPPGLERTPSPACVRVRARRRQVGSRN